MQFFLCGRKICQSLKGEGDHWLCRRITSFEYDSVLREADRLGFVGYCQSSESADKAYTPDFNTEEAFALIDEKNRQ